MCFSYLPPLCPSHPDSIPLPLPLPAWEQVTLFHSSVCEAIPEDYLLELADWAYRKLTYLNSKEAQKFKEPKGEERKREERLRGVQGRPEGKMWRGGEGQQSGGHLPQLQGGSEVQRAKG